MTCIACLAIFASLNSDSLDHRLAKIAQINDQKWNLETLVIAHVTVVEIQLHENNPSYLPCSKSIRILSFKQHLQSNLNTPPYVTEKVWIL